MADLNNHDSALRVAKAMRSVAQRQIEQERPPSRWAIVTALQPETRSCLVRFLGDGPDATPVRVPYTSVIPSREGQEVKIGGPANDRVIESIRGETEPEKRLYALEDDMAVRGVMAISYDIISDQPLNQNVASDVTFNRARWDAVAMPDPVNGVFTAPVEGYYDMKCKVGFDGGSVTNIFWARSWLYCIPLSGSRIQLDYDGFYVEGDSNQYVTRIGEVTLNLFATIPLLAGEKIVVSAMSNAPTGSAAAKVYAARTHIDISLKYGMKRYYKSET